MTVSPRHWPSSWMSQMPSSWAAGDRLYCNGHSGRVLRSVGSHPIMGTDAFEVQIDGWSCPVILSLGQMEMFVRVTG